MICVRTCVYNIMLTTERVLQTSTILRRVHPRENVDCHVTDYCLGQVAHLYTSSFCGGVTYRSRFVDGDGRADGRRLSEAVPSKGMGAQRTKRSVRHMQESRFKTMPSARIRFQESRSKTMPSVDGEEGKQTSKQKQ